VFATEKLELHFPCDEKRKILCWFEMMTCNVVVDVESVGPRYCRFTPPTTAPLRTMSGSSPLRVFDRYMCYTSNNHNPNIRNECLLMSAVLLWFKQAIPVRNMDQSIDTQVQPTHWLQTDGFLLRIPTRKQKIPT
jgi:hypothetical protein